MFENLTNNDTILYIAVAAFVLFVIIGFIKRVKVLVILGILIGIATFISSPTIMDKIESTIFNTSDGVFDPLSDDDYQDLQNEIDNPTIPTKTED